MKLYLFSKHVKQLFTIFLFFSFCTINAQSQKTITGTVLSAVDGMPLPGASVVAKGTNNGASTDFDGKFSLEVDTNATTLVISYLGFITQDAAITNSPINVTLEEDRNQLDEVVVVGYGSVRKSDLVSAVEKVNTEDAFVIPTSNVAEMLRGRVSGLKVDVGSLRPGGNSTLLFRGQRSKIGSNEAIFVVDGVIRDNGINDVNPDDIISIEFLKDASAQAIYGSRAVNGVVLVTTKRGKNRPMSINVHSYITTKAIKKNFDVYSGTEFANLRREAFRTDNVNDEFENDDFVFTQEALEALEANEFVNWEDVAIEDAVLQNQSISFSGGTENTQVFASFNYFDEDGIIPTSGFNRKSFRLNLDQKIIKGFKTAINIELNSTNQNKESQAFNVITLSPLSKAFNDDGSITQYPTGNSAYTSPLWNIEEANNKVKGNLFSINVVPEFNIAKNLNYKINIAFSRGTTNDGKYLSSQHQSGIADQGVATIFTRLRESYTVENIITYDNTFNDHKLNITAVQAIDEDKEESTSIIGKGFLSDDLGFNGIELANNISLGNRIARQFNTASFLGRVRYSYLDKYFFNATVRADGASVNSKGNKWTTNPAFGFAWKIHNEKFLENSNIFNELKLRISYGSLANQLKTSVASLTPAGEVFYVFGEETQPGFLPLSGLPSTDLEHEITTTLNIGLDFRLYKNILTGSVEYYRSLTDDFLLTRPVPANTGFSFTFANATGQIENKGIELSLTANIFDTQDFKWSVSTSWSKNENKILDIFGKDENGVSIDFISQGLYVGQPINTIRQFLFDGIWQEGEDFENSPQNHPDSDTPLPNLGPGSIRVKDINGRDDDGKLTGLPDGKITEADNAFIDRNPDWIASFSSNVFYKGFELSADFYVVEGATRSNPFLASFNNGGTLQGALNGIKVPFYTPENPSTSFPRPRSSSADPFLFSLAVKDASYVRLRTLKLGYTFKNINMSGSKHMDVNLYVVGSNLFTNTNYKGYSPEVDANGFPDSRSFTFGVKLNLN